MICVAPLPRCLKSRTFVDRSNCKLGKHSIHTEKSCVIAKNSSIWNLIREMKAKQITKILNKSKQKMLSFLKFKLQTWGIFSSHKSKPFYPGIKGTKLTPPTNQNPTALRLFFDPTNQFSSLIQTKAVLPYTIGGNIKELQTICSVLLLFLTSSVSLTHSGIYSWFLSKPHASTAGGGGSNLVSLESGSAKREIRTYTRERK